MSPRIVPDVPVGETRRVAAKYAADHAAPSPQTRAKIERRSALGDHDRAAAHGNDGSCILQ